MNLYIVKSNAIARDAQWRGYFVATDENEARELALEAAAPHGIVRSIEEITVDVWPDVKYETVPEGLEQFVRNATRSGQVFFGVNTWEWVRP